MDLRRYLSLAELDADDAVQPALLFISKNTAHEGLANALPKQLKGAKVHVVMDHCEHRNPSAAKPGQAIVRDDCKLPALLALLDDMNRATEQ
jgi:hypothetical protein